jgi:hypothetical protein
MDSKVSVFDLGNADTSDATRASALDDSAVAGHRPARQRPAAPRRERPAAPARSRLSPARYKVFERLAWLRSWPGITRTLSLLVPGAGQLVRGEITFGLFLLTTSTFLWAFAWSILETLDRLAGTLALLDLSILIVFWTLGGIYVLAAMLHLTGVLAAIDAPGKHGEVIYHPALTGCASALIPGWGQLLNGDRFRAGLFLAGVWTAGGIWLVLSPAATELISAYLPAVSAWEQAARRPGPLWIALYTFPAMLWVLAVYDATSSSIYRRR